MLYWGVYLFPRINSYLSHFSTHAHTHTECEAEGQAFQAGCWDGNKTNCDSFLQIPLLLTSGSPHVRWNPHLISSQSYLLYCSTQSTNLFKVREKTIKEEETCQIGRLCLSPTICMPLLIVLLHNFSPNVQPVFLF